MIRKSVFNILNKSLTIEGARKLGVEVKENCRFIKVTKATFGSEPYLIKLGNHVTIAEGVRFITHDGGVWIFRDEDENIDVIKPITVADNVFIGINSLIMPGVNISNNIVIGAGSIVTKDLIEEGVYVGSPAKKIKNLQEYKTKSFRNNIGTKTLTSSDKRKYLLAYFEGEKDD